MRELERNNYSWPRPVRGRAKLERCNGSQNLPANGSRTGKRFELSSEADLHGAPAWIDMRTQVRRKWKATSDRPPECFGSALPSATLRSRPTALSFPIVRQT